MVADIDETEETTDYLNLCDSCEHLLKRLIVPYDYESYGINLEDYKLETGNDEVRLHNCICMKCFFEMDHDVIECNCYLPSTKGHCLLGNYDNIETI